MPKATDPGPEERRGGLPVAAFADAAAFDGWLADQARHSSGIWLRLRRKAAGTVSLSKRDAVDVALCHGWIDGRQDKYDVASWLTRFTPRKRRSRWSQVNRTRALEMIAEGRMRSAGLAEIEAARSDGRWDAAYPPASTAQIPPDLQIALDRSPGAVTIFATLTKSDRYAILYRIAEVKRPETRMRRIAGFVAMLGRSETVRR